MNKTWLVGSALVCMLIGGNIACTASADVAHTPKDGSGERRAILKALRTGPTVSLKVHYLKVHRGWAWADITPLDGGGKPIAEGGPEILHLKNGKWTVLDLAKVPEDPKDPLGAQDASVGFVRNLRKTFPGVPSDIFPKPAH